MLPGHRRCNVWYCPLVPRHNGNRQRTIFLWSEATGWLCRVTRLVCSQSRWPTAQGHSSPGTRYNLWLCSLIEAPPYWVLPYWGGTLFLQFWSLNDLFSGLDLMISFCNGCVYNTTTTNGQVLVLPEENSGKIVLRVRVWKYSTKNAKKPDEERDY